ncbi:hypothetical protein DL95DRAFT_499991, partial [Leptodontidium sp. 2 PMI_412]
FPSVISSIFFGLVQDFRVGSVDIQETIFILANSAIINICLCHRFLCPMNSSYELCPPPETKVQKETKQNKKHTTARIRWWSPTQLLICRSGAYVWQSGRDAQCSPVYGRM